MLKLNNLHVYYGAVHALKGVSLEVNEGEIVTLIGSNGAGKSTTIKAISGLVSPSSGSVEFMGKQISGMLPHQVTSLGVVQIPEGRRIFPEMSVRENLEMGAFCRRDSRGIERDIESVFDRFPRLRERSRQLAATLSGGEQQMLAVGRALMAHPKVLLLDEPSMGLAPILVQGVFEIIREINASGTTILLVEQNASMALAIADRGYVLQTGEIALAGPAEELLRSEEVRRVYLGEL
ncbi:MAG: ABC transporter ATP-binding protein [Firmicutes bacterium]|nr:ABC transporter ATP-binding protein [Bacillota bacterium]